MKSGPVERANRLCEYAPAKWIRAQLGEALPLSYGKGLNASNRRSGDVPVYGSGGIVGLHDHAITSGPTIIVGRKGCAGAVYYSALPCYPIDTVYYCEANYVDMRFAAYLLDYIKLTDFDQSTAIPSLAREQYNPITVPFPPPQHQRRIVEKIDELFSQIEAGERALERARRLLERYRQSVLKAAVTGELTRDWRERHEGEVESGEALLARVLEARREAWERAELERIRRRGTKPSGSDWKKRYEEPCRPDSSGLGDLPSGWTWASIEQLSLDVAYGTSAKCSENALDGVPVLRMGNIVEGEIDTKSLKYLNQEHREFPDLLLTSGDLLFNRTNSAELVGKTAVYDGRFDQCSFASYLIRVKTGDVNPHIISMYINSEAGRNWIRSVVSQQVGQANVNGRKLQALCVPLPPRVEQDRIVARADELLSLARHCQADLEEQERRSAALRQSILTAAFSGKLVPQDPADEPASVLLDRIRAERAAAAGAPRRRGRRARAGGSDPAPELPLV